ncbi:hypothetical protein N0V86_008545 [Didymella sp. IMI 355093]|nr:hypothetical protein N0V86_008545 [Didymella sp. IMI 355093]
MDRSTPTSAVSSQLSDQLSHDFGRISLQKGASSYTESDHWTSILEELGDFKDMLNGREDTGEMNDARPQPGLDLLLNVSAPATKLEILSSIPPRSVVDSMIARYFSSADMPVTLIIHRHMFFRQYEAFWERPFDTPIIWVTIVFGMMYQVAYYTLAASQDSGTLGDTMLSEYRDVVATARQKMMQCLHLDNYLKGSRHTIEALLFLLQIEYVQGEGAEYGCWQLIGVIIRTAIKMGYHRDGSHFTEMSAFDAEMRRRVWYILIQFDIASAVQVGLPRIIKESQCDTAEPHNLLDDDFDELSTALPPARPQTEHTLSQFLIYKSRIVSVYGMICDFTTSSKQRDYNEAMRLDSLLNRAYTGKPAVLEPKSMQKSIADGSHLITRRLYIAMSYHHAQMTLHRKFMIPAKTDRTYACSYRTCTEAALSALQYQRDLYEQCQPGRMLHSDRWKILSLIQSEFVLATTIICLDLDDDLTCNRYVDVSGSSTPNTERNAKALESSKAIWLRQQDNSKEAQTAVKAIDLVLDKLNNASVKVQNMNSPSPRQRFETSPYTATLASGAGLEELLPQDYLVDTVIPDSQDPSEWNELFDLDVPWDSWVQI